MTKPAFAQTWNPMPETLIYDEFRIGCEFVCLRFKCRAIISRTLDRDSKWHPATTKKLPKSNANIYILHRTQIEKFSYNYSFSKTP